MRARSLVRAVRETMPVGLSRVVPLAHVLFGRHLQERFCSFDEFSDPAIPRFASTGVRRSVSDAGTTVARRVTCRAGRRAGLYQRRRHPPVARHEPRRDPSIIAMAQALDMKVTVEGVE